MSFSDVFSRLVALAAELWRAQPYRILLVAGLYGFSYLLRGSAAEMVVALASLLQVSFVVCWLREGARSGDFAAAEAAPEDLPACAGVALGEGVLFAALLILSLVFLLLGPLGWLLAGFGWFVLLVLSQFYGPLVAVRARGFREALALTAKLLSSFERRQLLGSARFWYPALLGMAVSFLQLAVKADGGFTSAVFGFLLAAFQLAWYTAAQLVIYENVWKENDLAAGPA